MNVSTVLLAAAAGPGLDPAYAAQVAAAAVGSAVGLLVVIGMLRRLLYICRPNEMLIVSGKKTRLEGGETIDFAVIIGGRHWRTPVMQQVRRMDIRLIPIELRLNRVLSNGGIPLDIHAIANVKVTSDLRYVHNAVERFLNLPVDTIKTSARQTLEGVLRGVIANLTPEQVNEDRIEFTNRLLESTEEDFNKMGLHLDTLKIQRVEDEAQYLVNIGRTQIANAVRDAELAENQAKQEIAQQEAASRQQSEVARKQAEILVAQQRNQLRALRGQLEGEAQSVEREGAVAAEQARAFAEQELQEVRRELETKRLQAEVVLPAEAQRAAAELIAQGDAALRREQGAAAAEVMRLLAESLAAAGPNARDLFLLSQLDTLVAQVAAKVAGSSVQQIHVVDGGDGQALAALSASFPAAVVEVFRTMRDLTGFDLRELMAARPTGGAS